MTITTLHQGSAAYPKELGRLHKPPETVCISGRSLADIMNMPRVAVVGSRAMSPYGRQMTQDIVTQLVKHGVAIVSGLAYGVDAEAHQTTITNGGITLAVLPSPLQVIAPAGNQPLARSILASGGTLLSTYPEGSVAHKGNFVERNEYVAALSQLVLVVEAGAKSGARHTAAFASSPHISVPVFAVPGNITSPSSVGCNQLIRAQSADIFTDIADILAALRINPGVALAAVRGDTADEQLLLDLLQGGVRDGHELLAQSGQSVSLFNQTLTMLEIGGKIKPLGGNQWGLG